MVRLTVTVVVVFLLIGQFEAKLQPGLISDYKSSPIEGILKESLRSNRVQACDGERITLSCPRNTQISVQTGFYGRVVPEDQLCPSPPGRKSLSSALSSSDPLEFHHASVCDVIQAHTRISELCDKRRKCTVVVDSNTFEDDPCPTTSKYLQMAYGCMPVSFDEETFCTPKPAEPSRPEIHLECREGRRLAVYSAQMRTTPQCSSESEIRYECVSDVLPQVLPQCHAKESCRLKTADIKGHCRHGHLHIVYVCVNEEIFSEEAIKGELVSLEAYLKEAAAIQKQQNENILGDVHDKTQWEQIFDSEPAPTDASVHQIANDASYVTHDEYRMNPQDPPPVTERVEPNLVGVANDLFQIVVFFKENKEKTAMCVILAISMAAIFALSACIISRLCSSSKDTRSQNSSRSRRSLETSKLVSSNYGGSISPHMMQDIEDEQFLRFSMGSSKPNSTYTHYDF